jgi:hypothetical protein
MLIRCESSHAFLKKYLGGKKTYQTLYTTWRKIEAAIRDRLMNIEVSAATSRGSTPLSIDQKLFRPVFGVVTWHALQLVSRHVESMSHPLKPCTGTFTRSMGLPCAHVCNAKKDLGGVVSDDFDEHWFWNRRNVHRPFREPRQARTNTRLQNRPQASSGRILSSFETGASPARAAPMCSACHQRGHTRTSRHCPERLRRSIAEQSLELQRNEVQQALRIPQTPLRIVARPSTSPTDSFHTAASDSDLFRAVENRNIPENAHNQPNTLQEAQPKTPQRTFRMPLLTYSPRHCTLSSLDSNITPTHSTLTVPITPCPHILPSPVPASPQSPFPINCPEMVYERYLREKEAWLLQHPDVDSKDYRTARGLPILSHEVLRNQLHTMPYPRVNDTWRCRIRWTDEEIYAWTDYEQAQEDRLVDAGLAISFAAGRLIRDGELQQVQTRLHNIQEAEAFNAMRYLN